eukprot:530521-Karenia_brevis.AAC.1
MSQAVAARMKDLLDTLEMLIGPKGVVKQWQQRAFCFSVDNTRHQVALCFSYQKNPFTAEFALCSCDSL